MEEIFFSVHLRKIPHTTNSKTFLASCHCSQRGGKHNFSFSNTFFFGGGGGGNVGAEGKGFADRQDCLSKRSLHMRRIKRFKAAELPHPISTRVFCIAGHFHSAYVG